MNKKYQQFTAGTYGASKIFLIADPITGQLSKIPLSALPGANPILKTFTTQESNTIAGWSNHYEFIVPANKFANDGDTMELDYYGTSTGQGQTKSFINRFRENGTLWSSFTDSNNWYCRTKYMRTNVSQMQYAREAQSGNNTPQQNNFSFDQVDYSLPINTHMELNGASANIINLTFAIIKFYQGNN